MPQDTFKSRFIFSGGGNGGAALGGGGRSALQHTASSRHVRTMVNRRMVNRTKDRKIRAK
jgi:hypothetical protein